MKTAISENLLSAFRHYRAHDKRDSASGRVTLYRASDAIHWARKDVSEGKKRYSGSPWRKPCGNGTSTDGARWIEDPAAMGLRFVGYCDEIYRHIDHKGWFTDPFQESTIRGVVYQLPGRDGKARFVAGHDNDDNGRADRGGPAYVDFSTIYESDFVAEMNSALRSIGKQYQTEAMRKPGYWAEGAHETARNEAARAADGFAGNQAEKEREYQTAWQAGVQYSECLSELATIRESVLATIRDIKGACATLRALPETIRARLKASLESDMSERAGIFSKMEALMDGDFSDLIFYPNESTKAAFNDGAGKAVLR